MLKKMCIVSVLWIFLMLPVCSASDTAAGSEDAMALVAESFNYFRGKASIALVDMVVHRPVWERRMTIKTWTVGEKNSLFRIVAPAKDKGNGTLKKGREMWMYNPKVNRVIKLPPSMMSQSWMGSDFSNNDLSKSDTLLSDYRHKIVGTETHEGKKVYLIESLPLPAAPVIWGMQKLKIREDRIFLSQAFFDEDHKLVKALRFLEIQMLGDRLYPKKWVMQKAGETDAYTIVAYQDLVFKTGLPGRLFTLSNLRNPGR